MTINADLLIGLKVGGTIGTLVGAVLGFLGGVYIQYACSSQR